MMRNLLILFILFFPISAVAEVEGATSSFDVKQLMHQLAQVKISNAKFVEKKYLKVLKTPIESQGILSYQAPSRIEKHTTSPKKEDLILDGDKLHVESARGSRRLSLQDYPAVWAFVESIRSTLAGDITTLNKFYQVELKGEYTQWQLNLMPSDKKTQDMVSKIHISGRNDRVEEIEIFETNGDRSVMLITESGRGEP